MQTLSASFSRALLLVARSCNKFSNVLLTVVRQRAREDGSIVDVIGCGVECMLQCIICAVDWNVRDTLG